MIHGLRGTSIAELGRHLRSGEVSTVELTETTLEQLDSEGRSLNAVATLTGERALAEARRAADELRRGIDRGPLHGIPYGAKDLLDTAGIATSWGAAPFRDRVPEQDAAAIERLRDAGAILVAKLAMVELAGGFGYDQADASLTGPGLNAWDKGAWSGGSSSGSGSAVGAGLVPFAIGSETWGSITTPSAFNGISGLRPTYDRVSRRGAMALVWSMDKIGPMARSAADCRLVFDAIAASGDTHHSRGAQRLRIGVLEGSTAGVQPGVDANFEASLEVLRAQHTLGGFELPALPLDEAALTIILCEGAAAFEDFIDSGRQRELTAPEDRTGLYDAMVIPAVDYIKAARIRTAAAHAMAEVFDRFDIVVAPTLPAVANGLADSFEEYFGRYPAPSLGAIGNLCGLPSISVPNGFGERGLPTGLEIVGAPGNDGLVLGVAEDFQTTTEWHLRLP